MTKTMTLKELRPELPKVIEQIDQKLDRYVITKRGKPVAVMLGVDDYESLIETLDITADKDTMKRLRKADEEINKDQTVSWRTIKRKHEK